MILFEYYTIKGFIDFCEERESIRKKREQNKKPPLTSDKILRVKKFCNIDRNHDRGTKTLFEFLSKIDNPRDKILFCITYRHLSSGNKLLETMSNYKRFDDFVSEIICSESKLQIGSIAYQLRLYQDFNMKRYVLEHIVKFQNEIVSFVLNANNLSFDYFINNINDIIQFRSKLIFINLQFALDIIELFPKTIDKNSQIHWGCGSKNAIKKIAIQEQLSLDECLEQLQTKSNFHQIVLEHALCEYDKYCKYVDGSKDFNKKVKNYHRTNDYVFKT
jgi:hypothetical protein